MRRCFKRLSILCVITLVMSCTTNHVIPGNGFVKSVSAAMDYNQEIEIGQLYTVELNHKYEADRERIFQFVPAEDGTYIFYSLSDYATVAYLYNENGSEIGKDDDRTGRSENFSLECELEAGKTYYFKAQFAERHTRSGSFSVGLRKAVSEAELNASRQLTVGAGGLDYEIKTAGEFVHAQFSPESNGYYNIYTRNACGQLGICGENDGCEAPCSCLSTIFMEIFEKDDQGELQSLYLADAKTEGGAVLRNYFEAGKNYYIEMSASDCQKTGNFKLYAATGLADAPVEQLKLGTTVESPINGNNETLIYKIVPDKTASYRFLANEGSHLYMSLCNNELKEICYTTINYDGFNEVVELEEGQTYYFVVNAAFDDTNEAVFSVEETSSQPENPTEEDPKEENPKEEDPKEETPKEENPSGNDTSQEGDVSGDKVQTEGDGPSTGDVSSEKINLPGIVPLDEVDITPIKNQKYTGKKLFPAITVSYQGTPLKVNEDYTAVYKSNKNIGVGSVTLTGRGSFSGTQKITFKIVPAKVTISQGKRTGNKLSLKWKKVKGATNYEITYAYSSSFKKAKKLTVKNCKATIKLTSAKKCYVKVRAYKKVKGKKYFGTMSKKKKY